MTEVRGAARSATIIHPNPADDKDALLLKSKEIERLETKLELENIAEWMDELTIAIADWPR